MSCAPVCPQGAPVLPPVLLPLCGCVEAHLLQRLQPVQCACSLSTIPPPLPPPPRAIPLPIPRLPALPPLDAPRLPTLSQPRPPSTQPPALRSTLQPQVSGDPRGFDLTGDGERWEAAGGDEISEAGEFATVSVGRALPACLPASALLEANGRVFLLQPLDTPVCIPTIPPPPPPAGAVRQVGGRAWAGSREPGVGAGAGGWAPVLARCRGCTPFVCRDPCVQLRASAANALCVLACAAVLGPRCVRGHLAVRRQPTDRGSQPSPTPCVHFSASVYQACSLKSRMHPTRPHTPRRAVGEPLEGPAEVGARPGARGPRLRRGHRHGRAAGHQ